MPPNEPKYFKACRNQTWEKYTCTWIVRKVKRFKIQDIIAIND
jgi:hypothetical protein